jgi:hypothetical protein
MAFDNQSNHKRVTKMVEMFELIEKSARSNEASPEDIAALLTPLLRAIESAGVPLVPPSTADAAPEQEARPVHMRGMTPPPWASVREMAEQASLSDLAIAMAVFMNRYEEGLATQAG